MGTEPNILLGNISTKENSLSCMWVTAGLSNATWETTVTHMNKGVLPPNAHSNNDVC